MTFCLGIRVREGLLALADTRVTTGAETITARKLTIHQHRRHAMFLMTSGLRSVRDKALTYFQEVLEDEEPAFRKMYQVLNAFGAAVRRVAKEDRAALEEGGYAFNLHALVGGQLSGDAEHKLYMLYPQGNWVEVSMATPYFIIGETTYGKPLLDRVLTYESDLDTALRTGYLAFDATRTSATDVDFPLDAVLYRRDTFRLEEHRYERAEMWETGVWWQQHIRSGVERLPADWTASLIARRAPSLRLAPGTGKRRSTARARKRA